MTKMMTMEVYVEVASWPTGKGKRKNNCELYIMKEKAKQ